ncbi:MAG: thiamine-phosphate kinase [Candidatus Heimdallarchaeota archaeon]|nr:thiamine-phosphate kinase [Candidatus Heimdallarchaeota archaeon]MCK5049267.1 thiamine-phosphate kinase [Candidatus Heimdallarchaeota archaeon]
MGQPSSTLNDFGEQELIILLKKYLNEQDSPLLAPEDCMSHRDSEDNVSLFNADMFVETTDRPPGMTFDQIGRKIVAMSVSDIASKGGITHSFLLSLGLPGEMTLSSFEELIQGVAFYSSQLQINYLGGDLNQASELIGDGIAIGYAKANNLMRRSSAQPGDLVIASHSFGWTTLGLLILLKGVKAPENIKENALKEVYNPQAKAKLGTFLGESQLVKCCSDSSDGLARTLYNILESSNINGVKGLQITHLPIEEELLAFCKEAKLAPEELVFYGGEEYHLVYTVSKNNWEKLLEKAKKREINLGVIIGEISSELSGINLKDKKIANKGYSHFSQ